MNSLLERARGSVRVQQQATRVRAIRDRWIDMPLKQIEQARRQLNDGGVDVLLLGDSSSISFSWDDTDRTLIPDLLRQRIGGKLVSVSGPGYGARVHKEAVRILGTLPVRPKAVVVNLCIRPNVCDQIIKHPTYGYIRSAEALAKVTSAKHPIRYVGRGGIINGKPERDAFLALPMHTRWGGDTTIAAFRDRIMGHGPPPWPAELESFRFDYFHGFEVPERHEGLDHLIELGRRLVEYDVPVVPLWIPPPVERGELHFPGEFAPHVRANFERVDNAFHTALPDAPTLDLDFEDDEFEDSQNGTEHFSFGGRVKVADALADRIHRS